jgi:hypothetical protein
MIATIGYIPKPSLGIGSRWPEVVDQEFHRWLETIEGCLVPFGLKSYLFERQKEGIDVL